MKVETPQTDELRRQWGADPAGLDEFGWNPPGWRAFESAISLCARLESRVHELQAEIRDALGVGQVVGCSKINLDNTVNRRW